MAKSKANRLEKYGIRLAVVTLRYDDRGDYQNPSVRLLESDGNWARTVMRMEFQRHRLSLTRNAIGSTASVHDKHGAIEQAQAMRAEYDVGGAAYSHAYAAHLDDVRPSTIGMMSAVLKTLGYGDAGFSCGEEMHPFVEALRAAGCPVSFEYMGASGVFTDRFDVPKGYKGNTAEFARSVDAVEALAEYHAEAARRMRETCAS